MTPSFFRRKQNERKNQKNFLAIQFRAQIVPSGSPGQVNFLAGQVTFKGFLPNGQGSSSNKIINQDQGSNTSSYIKFKDFQEPQ